MFQVTHNVRWKGTDQHNIINKYIYILNKTVCIVENKHNISVCVYVNEILFVNIVFIQMHVNIR